MIKKVVKFLDKHRIILVILVLLLVSAIFFSIKSWQFLNYKFKSLECTKKIDETYCYNNDTKMFINAEKVKKEFLEENINIINKLKEEYDLPDFNIYTAYYYEVVSDLDYDINGTNKFLVDFFEIYSNTYDLKSFYKNNIFYYEIYYSYKIF